jgi:hypothetical protein
MLLVDDNIVFQDEKLPLVADLPPNPTQSPNPVVRAHSLLAPDLDLRHRSPPELVIGKPRRKGVF